MAKRLCCGFRGKIYYTDVNEKEGIMVDNQQFAAILEQAGYRFSR